MPGIRLEIDEDGHKSYDDRKEKHSEEVISAFNRRIHRTPVDLKATDEDIDAD